MSLTLEQTIQEADRCVACGLCLPHCPTYYKTGSEADSPRGRIQLISAVAKEILPNNARFKAHIDLCLSCRNCETACPNNVRYGAIIDSARTLVSHDKAQQKAWPLSLLAILVQHPLLLSTSSQLLRMVQKLGLVKLIGRLPPNTAKALSFIPPIAAAQRWQSFYPATGQQQGEVSLFLGCITNAFDADTLRASVFVLNQLGYGVHIPKIQACCGGLARQQGDDATSTAYIKQNQAAFKGNSPVITVASGCGAGLKDYTSLNIQDISDFLNRCDWQSAQLKPLNAHVAVHDPCTLRNVQKTHTAVYSLLNKIPQARVTSLKGNAQCCGGAGAYMLNQPDMAAQLLQDKMQSLQAETFDYLVTSNIGCALHIGSGIHTQRLPIKVLHPVSLIAKQMGFNADLD